MYVCIYIHNIYIYMYIDIYTPCVYIYNTFTCIILCVSFCMENVTLTKMKSPNVGDCAFHPMQLGTCLFTPAGHILIIEEH